MPIMLVGYLPSALAGASAKSARWRGPRGQQYSGTFSYTAELKLAAMPIYAFTISIGADYVMKAMLVDGPDR